MSCIAKTECVCETVNRWCATWITDGFDAIESLLAGDATRGDFCFGQTPTLVDVYLIPQVESARRFKVDLGRWPLAADRRGRYRLQPA